MIVAKKEKYFIHKSSYVETSDIGEKTNIWQFSVILENVVIGHNCNICAHTFIENNVSIGNNVTIKSGVFLWDGIKIDDNVFIGPNASFTNDLYPRSKKKSEIVYTSIKNGASLGANCSILAGLTIGKYSMIGMGAVITKDVPDFALIYGNPGKIKGWVDENGNKLIKLTKSDYKSIDGKKYVLKNNIMKKAENTC